ncbi:UDP-N-acetylmuramoyl-L-alanyl-D-glutamate--2,6-diaminopimelate ligase [Clostridium sp. YIM B02551]|uniref:UDP-N-acetylmuramoyl-L-alanyl-D-glutamate--2, 6-diaminopimelate ligase n=1 Tax=Clostridium sp. YIM B02551 TaxID=2910679 RepID=UPI001EEBE419|nr:UDP-N-acetylmuramoyl-L-alanyl-D-glutamate--2,6-diaminopimelate ligase [Clostridium sp. YIM B02551]
MLLEKLLCNIDYCITKGELNIQINDVKYDNRKVTAGDIFVCIKGTKVDGHNFATDAIERGASVIITEKELNINSDYTEVVVKDSRKALAIISANYFGNPVEKLKLIGVTGTNGKTTTAFMIKSILENEGIKTGLIGTIANYIGNKEIKTERTTPESYELHQLFRQMIDEDVECCVMEVSSHSLELDRVYGIKFNVGIFTNLTRDHLDFHGTFENYYKAKYKLFENSYYKVINIDDKYGERIVEELLIKGEKDRTLSFSISKEADFEGENITINGVLSSFNVINKNDMHKISLQIPGDYNVHNALGAIGATRILGISWDSIINALKNTVVAGRCERIGYEFNKDFEIINDYAHTPDGLENILSTARKFTKNRLICIFGCGGDRDKQKRGEMGEIATRLCDYVIVTSDNPRSEEPIEIINDIVRELKVTNYEIIENRYNAIEKGISICKDGDVLIIAGKGHETYQILKDKVIDFDERKVVKEILERR